MAFKIKPPYNTSEMNTTIFRNLEGQALGMAHKNGNISINKNIKEGTELYNEVKKHESVHSDQFKPREDGLPLLWYDDKNTYWRPNSNAKFKVYKRSVTDGSPKMEWEQKAYAVNKKKYRLK
jgi:hypothetical protein